ncbi:hypothetical protein PHET_04101 [Paragonimus heterotremus]|uniref:C2 DOCK-type domain-containing protein n=1 Tax=Paragonimus heterotremus TaxID=100268 RepID=A0A8J4WSA3_9TREM|nr:hypothetical protein PHET_04101 [Paragonimus heterotremus]
MHTSTNRSWTTAVMPTRSRQLTLDSTVQNGEFNRTTEGSSSAEALQVSKLRGLHAKSRSLINGRTDNLLCVNDALTDGNVVDQICPSGDKPTVAPKTYVESPLAIGTREMYASYLRVREGFLASGQENALQTTTELKMTLKPYCLRQLRADELSGRLNTVDRPRQSMDSSVPRMMQRKPTDQHLRAGMHVIAPLGWRAFGYERPEDCEQQNVIFLDTVDTVHAIGDRWLKLDRIPANQLCQMIKPGSLPSELFIYFDQSVGGADKRQVWLQHIQDAINAERSRQLLGYQRSFEYNCYATRSGPDFQATTDQVDRSSHEESDEESVALASIRNALQRYAQETEFLISHQRQKNRLRLITIHPEVRHTYELSAVAAEERSRLKWASHSAFAHRVNSLSRVIDSRTSARLNGYSLSKELADSAVSPPTSPIPFPDRTDQLCARRFLVTCLELKSRVQAAVDNPTEVASAAQLDNPEPYFVTMFLLNTADGRRVSEDFHWNPNTSLIDAMIPAELYRQLAWANGSSPNESKPSTADNMSAVGCGSSTVVHTQTVVNRPALGLSRPGRGHAPPPPLSPKPVITPHGMKTSLQPGKLAQCRSALFSVPTNLSSVGAIFLVIRVDKVLNGMVGTAVDRYTKAAQLTSGGSGPPEANTETENKLATALYRSMITYCRHLGRYRMPFVWGARSLCSRSHSVPLFKVDPNKLSESSFVHLVQSLARLSESGAMLGSLSNVEKRATLTSGLPPTWDSVGREEPTVDSIERNLKTQSVPIRLEVAVSELVEQSDDSSAHSLHDIVDVVSPDLLLVMPDQTHPQSKSRLSLPASHPPLVPNEVIREVEHLWDPRTTSIASASGSSGDPITGISGDADLSILSGHSVGSLHRVSQLASAQQQSLSVPGKSNRDSFVSTSSAGAGGGCVAVHSTDTLRSSSSRMASSRTNSLDRPCSPGPIDGGMTVGRVPSAICEPVPVSSFSNTLYVSPKSLNLAVKHNFARARNLSCFIELRSSDDLRPSSALKVFHTRPSSRQPEFDSWFNTAVIYHEASPHFTDTAKLCLPLHLTTSHHLLFRFYHVSVDTAGSLTVRDRSMGKKPLESSTGYAWLPLLGTDGNINTGLFQLPIAPEIQPGYLQLRSSMTRPGLPPPTSANNAMDMTSISWLENGKPLFTIQLDCLSTIYTHDPSLSRFFRACGELLDRVLALPLHSTTPGSKSKANRVTFRDDLVEQVVTPIGSVNDQLRDSGRFRSENPACILHLCNAIKSLLLIDKCALVRFLPALFNQFMEIILIGAAAGHRPSDTQSVTHDSSVTGTNCDTGIFWFDPVSKSHSGGTPNDLLKTTMGTMSMLISELNSSCPFNKDNWSMQKASEGIQNRERVIGGSDNIRHPLLKAYVKYAFDASTLTTECLAIYSGKNSPEQQLSNNSSDRKLGGPLPLPLYHALVRSLVLMLADLNCARHILIHLVTNLWFSFALIVKSMTQYLCISQKIKTDRHGESRFSTMFCDDLTLLIRLIGARVSSSSSASQPHATGCRLSTGSGLDRRTGLSLSAVGHPTSSGGAALEAIQLTSCRISSTSLPLNVTDSNPSRHGATLVSSVCDFPSSDPSFQRHGDTVAQHNTITTTPEHLIAQTSRSGSLGNAVNGLDVLAVTARFLCHLFNLMDRGYVMKRVRDLLIFLEIAPRMSVEEIDHLNELRFQLLNCLSQHEFFVQLNLPILASNQGTADWVDTTLAVLHDFESRPTYELRLTERFLQEHFLIGIILSGVACLLAGCVDTGGWAVGNTPSHLYRQPLSLLRNLLAKHSLDPRYAGSRPCQARIAALYLPLISLVLENPHVLGPPGEALKAAVIAAAARGELCEPSISDASSSISASDWIRNKRGTDTSSKQPGSSLPPSRPRSVVSELSLETLAGGTSMRSASSSGSLSASNGSDGSISCKTEASASTNHSSVAYLTKDDKVAPHILNRIAGVPIRRAQWRDRSSQVARSPGDLNAQIDRIELTTQNGPTISSSHTGSTITLTETEEDPDETETNILPNPISRSRLYSNKGEELNSIRMVDDGAEQDWSNQVFALAGVLPSTQTTRPSLPYPGTEKLHSSNENRLDTSRAPSLHSSLSLKESTTTMTTELPTQVHQHRLPTGYLPTANLGPRRLTDKSQRELFICLLHILSTVTEEHVIALYRGFSLQERIYFLQVLNYAIQHLRYRGKKCIQKYEHISRSGVGRGATIHTHGHGVNKRFGSINRYHCGVDEVDDKRSTVFGQSTDFKVLLEANLATEAGLIVLDLLQTFHNVFKQELESCKPTDPIFKGILDVYIALLVHNPSDHLIRHTFAALRMFVTRYSKVSRIHLPYDYLANSEAFTLRVLAHSAFF